MEREFKVGEPYFMLTYFDKDYKFLSILSLVFLGKNIEKEEDGGDLWFFQDAESYVRSGNYKTTKTKGERSQIYDFPEDQLSAIFAKDELIEALKEQG